MVFVETSFPRGGIAKPKHDESGAAGSAFQKEDKMVISTHEFASLFLLSNGTNFASFISQIFGAVSLPKSKKPKLSKKEREALRAEKTEEAAKSPAKIEAVSAELLSFKTIREGMIIMGCIKSIDSTSISVALPGRITGKVAVTGISQSYVTAVSRFVADDTKAKAKDEDDDDHDDNDENDTSITENDYRPIDKIFHIGQVVCVKVLNVEIDKSVATVDLSMQPNAIHANYEHTNVKKGMILSVALAERGEHGFVIETGIANLRGFLPDGKITETDRERLAIGGVYFCRVDSVKSSSAASTAIFKLSLDTESRTLKETNEPNVNHIMPGTLAKFNVTKIMKNGLQGSLFGGNLIGYINEHQLGTTNRGKRFSRPTDFEKDTELLARVLYVMPLTKLVYLSLHLQDKFTVSSRDDGAEGKLVAPGTIVEEARVSHVGTGGVVLSLGGKAKGVISFRSMRVNITANFDMDEILAKYAKNSTHKVRVLHYDPIDLLHVCSVDPKVLKEKFYTVDDVSVGDFVDAIVKRKTDDGRHEVTVGAIRGYIDAARLAPTTTGKQLEPGKRLRCRVVCKSVKKNHLFLTNRKEYMKEDASILTSADGLAVGSRVYLGTVKHMVRDGWVVEFFNYVRGMVYRNLLNESELSAAERFCEGQVAKFTIKKLDKRESGLRIVLGLADFHVDVGVVHGAKVSQVLETGLEVAIVAENKNGIVPIMYLSDYPSLVHAVHQSYRCNDNIRVVGVSRTCYSKRDVRDCLDESAGNVKAFQELDIGDTISAFIKNVHDDIIEVQCLLKTPMHERIHTKMLLENYANAGNINLVPDQKILVNILAKNTEVKMLTCSAKLHDVWHGDFGQTARIFSDYFDDVAQIRSGHANDKHAICAFQIGTVVDATPLEEQDEAPALKKFQLNGDVIAVVTAVNDGNKLSKKKQKMLIVWIDYVNLIVYGTTKKQFIERIEDKKDEKAAAEALLAHRGLKADVLLILDDLVVLFPRKVTNRFVYVPTRLHYNDFQPVMLNGVTEGAIANITAIDTSGKHFIGVFDHVWRLYEKYHVATKPLVLLPKPSASDSGVEEEMDVEDDSDEAESGDSGEEIEQTPPPAKKSKRIQGAKKSAVKKSPMKVAAKAAKRKVAKKIPQLDGAMDMDHSDDSDSGSDDELKLPGVSNFWSTDLNVLNGDGTAAATSSSEESSSDDEAAPPSKKKLTSEERFAAVRNEEARVRAIEQSYADDDVIPTTVDQFDRSVMAEPNSSRAWINYMVFHVQATEIDRARAIAQKALKTINFRETQERLNIWVAMMNLELRFGSKDAFEDTLKEALKLNEPFKIYTIVLQILADCRRVAELCDTVLTYTKKFRQMPECWLNAAQAYFQVDLVDKAKPLLTRALTTLPERERKLPHNYCIVIVCIPFGLKFSLFFGIFRTARHQHDCEVCQFMQ